jgi:hypothetical protein
MFWPKGHFLNENEATNCEPGKNLKKVGKCQINPNRPYAVVASAAP